MALFIEYSPAVQEVPGSIPYKFGQALFKLGEINEDEDSAAAHNSFRARNRFRVSRLIHRKKIYGSFIGQKTDQVKYVETQVISLLRRNSLRCSM
jgi:hypothetical protein